MYVMSHGHALSATSTQQRMETQAIGPLCSDFVLIFDCFCESLIRERKVDFFLILYLNLKLLSLPLVD